MRDIIDQYHVPTQSPGPVTQVNCPFHGNDSHASARIYETNSMYCWVCNKSWDVIGFVRDIEKVTFAEACSILENRFSIVKSDIAEIVYSKEESFKEYLRKENETKEKDFEKDFEKINYYLIQNKKLFSMGDYVRLFHYYDNLYSLYKNNRHVNDSELENSIKCLSSEVRVIG